MATRAEENLLQMNTTERSKEHKKKINASEKKQQEICSCALTSLVFSHSLETFSQFSHYKCRSATKENMNWQTQWAAVFGFAVGWFVDVFISFAWNFMLLNFNKVKCGAEICDGIWLWWFSFFFIAIRQMRLASMTKWNLWYLGICRKNRLKYPMNSSWLKPWYTRFKWMREQNKKRWNKNEDKQTQNYSAQYMDWISYRQTANGLLKDDKIEWEDLLHIASKYF